VSQLRELADGGGSFKVTRDRTDKSKNELGRGFDEFSSRKKVAQAEQKKRMLG